MKDNIEISNCNKWSEKELFSVRTKLSYGKNFSLRFSAIDVKRTQIFLNKPIYLGESTLEISRIAMYEFWYDYVKPKCTEKAKLCYMGTDSFIVSIKT